MIVTASSSFTTFIRRRYSHYVLAYGSTVRTLYSHHHDRATHSHDVLPPPAVSDRMILVSLVSSEASGSKLPPSTMLLLMLSSSTDSSAFGYFDYRNTTKGEVMDTCSLQFKLMLLHDVPTKLNNARSLIKCVLP